MSVSDGFEQRQIFASPPSGFGVGIFYARPIVSLVVSARVGKNGHIAFSGGSEVVWDFMIKLLAFTDSFETLLILAVILIIFWPFKGGGPRFGFFCAAIDENECRPEKPRWKPWTYRRKEKRRNACGPGRECESSRE